MKTHILLTILTITLLTACASREGRKVSSTQETPEQQTEHAKFDGNAGRDLSKQ
jgi:hypothetical protein